MRKAGIFTRIEVGNWIKSALKVKIQQSDLAVKLERFLETQGRLCCHYNYYIKIKSVRKETRCQCTV